LKLTDKDYEKYPEHTVVGKFIKLVEARADLDPEIKQKVLSKGVSMLVAD